nr:immunoglobulin heavy chain junction region [Macaca mulatta]MOV40042.1 immunoglobulin heavy chain junction region [Macaca mulatta]MOV41378.1 immunoglobulin heavy chain junction region [Macaca mulatta]MOV42927.1 immunoglobulin heavy chain junction region [Macaca mulatta]MOV43636.1 immunoglobulin heavy chain junction region [Macaca mulatta]
CATRSSPSTTSWHFDYW